MLIQAAHGRAGPARWRLKESFIPNVRMVTPPRPFPPLRTQHMSRGPLDARARPAAVVVRAMGVLALGDLCRGRPTVS